ncbi:MAG: TIGR03905 family TSCPD domain-containing protein [Defluviitaleaceae bacterium]|nr:TIGR03905 family TSCPD domain-containing protein [Defluviitaleaceae bacterium]
MNYKTQGTCSTDINIEVENGIVKNIEFIKGCNGNAKGVAALAKDRPITEVIAVLEGIKCGQRETSCPDQLATALKTLL